MNVDKSRSDVCVKPRTPRKSIIDPVRTHIGSVEFNAHGEIRWPCTNPYCSSENRPNTEVPEAQAQALEELVAIRNLEPRV